MKTLETLFIAATFATLGALSIPALADGPKAHPKVGEMKPAQGGPADMTDAEVRKVDMAQGKITLKHGEIKSLDMPPMTMVFSVKDKAMLQTVKPGDKIMIKVANLDGKLTVTDIAPAK